MRKVVLVALTLGITHLAEAQLPIKLVKQVNRVDVLVGNKPFTSLLYPDSLPKPVLFPVIAPDGQTVTRGFPLAPRADDTTDHPHHIGIWLNFENLNGLDFWNNSYAIPAENKHRYGSIRDTKVTETRDGKKAVIGYTANWTQPDKATIVTEKTSLQFEANDRYRRIDRITTLTAVKDALFKDAKDGLMGFRVARSLQLPRADYLNSEGQKGDSVWSKRARWVRLSGKMGDDVVSIVIIDHPKNPGYPTYWHARGYGLFAVNPLGAAVFSHGADKRDLHLTPGQSVQFHYVILVASGKEDLDEATINKIAAGL